MLKEVTLGQMFINMLEDIKSEVSSLDSKLVYSHPNNLQTVKDYNSYVEDWIYDIEAKIELGLSDDVDYDKNMLEELRQILLDFQSGISGSKIIEIVDYVIGFLE